MEEVARFVTVVQDVQFLELVEHQRVDVVPGLDVVVVVGRDVEGTESAIASRLCQCEDVGGRERDVLRKDGVSVSPRRHQIERNADDAVGASEHLAPHETHGCRDLHRRLRAQVEDGVEEEHTGVEMLPRLGEIHVVHAFDAGYALVGGRAELAHPVRLRIPLSAEEDLRSVGRALRPTARRPRSPRAESPARRARWRGAAPCRDRGPKVRCPPRWAAADPTPDDRGLCARHPATTVRRSSSGDGHAHESPTG